MKLNIAVTLLILTVLFGSAGFADSEPIKSDPNRCVSLSDYLQYAALHNTELKNSFERFKSAVEAVPQARSFPYPRVTYGYFMEDLEAKIGTERQKFGLKQTFPWFGEISARTDTAALTAKAAQKQYEAAKLKLFCRVKKAYYEYACLVRSVEIIKANLKLLEHFEESAAGNGRDISHTQSALAALTEKLHNLEQKRQAIVDRLNSILNRPDRLPLPMPHRQRYEPVTIDKGKLLPKVLSNNPELAALDFEAAAAQSRLKLAKKNAGPDVNVRLDWVQTDNAPKTGTNDSSQDPVVAMISLNLPVWTGSYKITERRARADLRQISIQKVQAETDIVSLASEVFSRFQDNSGTVTLYADVLIPMAKMVLNAERAAYLAGTTDLINLLDAQRVLMDFELSYEMAVTDSLQALAELEMLTGRQMDEQAI